MEAQNAESDSCEALVEAIEKNLEDLRKYADNISEMRVEVALLELELISKLKASSWRDIEALCGVSVGEARDSDAVTRDGGVKNEELQVTKRNVPSFN